MVAVVVASFVVALILWLAARQGRVSDPTDVRTDVATVAEEARRHPAFRRFLRQRRNPATATGLLLTIALGVTAFTILMVGLVLEMVQRHWGFARWDERAAEWGATHSTPVGRTILKGITQVGATPIAVIVVTVVAIVEYRRIPTRAVPLFLATVVGSELLLNNVVKWIVTRPRPDIARFVDPTGSSFPSGHTACAAATYAAVALVVGRRRSRRTRAILAAIAGALTAAVATTRVLLGVHWLTDVIAGAMLGWSVFVLCSIAFGGRLLEFGQPVEPVQEAVKQPGPGQAPMAMSSGREQR
jgi:undecaprenyl-diphosphatase